MLSSNSRLLGALFWATVLLAACGGSADSQVVANDQTTSEPATTVLASSSKVDPTDHNEQPDDHEEHEEHEDHKDAADNSSEASSIVGDAEPADATTTIIIDVVDGQVVGGFERVSAEVGSIVLIQVHLDAADEVHLHGYDLTAVGASGEKLSLAFVAAIPGVWEAELERAGIKLLELEVS